MNGRMSCVNGCVTLTPNDPHSLLVSNACVSLKSELRRHQCGAGVGHSAVSRFAALNLPVRRPARHIDDIHHTCRARRNDGRRT